MQETIKHLLLYALPKAMILGLLLAICLSFYTTLEFERNQLLTAAAAQSSPTPTQKKAKREKATPTPICSPLPTPDINESIELSLEVQINYFGGTPDFDCDGVCNSQDNCLTAYNPDQKDDNKDGKGNACDPKLVGESFVDSRCDSDGDGIADLKDNCPAVCNPNQKFVDVNNNKVNDLCDSVLPNYVGNQPCEKRRKVKPPRRVQ